MAQIKLLFPTLANAGNLFQIIAPHSALLSIALPDDQTQESTEKVDHPKLTLPNTKKWRKVKEESVHSLFIGREKVHTLSSAKD